MAVFFLTEGAPELQLPGVSRLCWTIFFVIHPSGHGINHRACTTDADCGPNNCCTASMTCSRRRTGSVGASKRAGDACECVSQTIDASTGRCACTSDEHCPGNKCCGVNGKCSLRDKASVFNGKIANDICACGSGKYDPATRRCGCTINRHCAGNTCCKADFHCSSTEMASILTGDGPAADRCECASGNYDEATEKCVCKKDLHCEGLSCCRVDGTCSEKDISSVLPGGIASDACECSTRSFDSATGQCNCRRDSQCPGETCCGVNGICSTRDKGSVPPGFPASDICECVRKNRYNEGATPGTGFCGCMDNSNCEGDTCCTDDGTCSKRAMGSVPIGTKASDVCECATSAYNSDTKRCVCGHDSQCPDDKCCTADGRCSVRAMGSVQAGLVAFDACECSTSVFFPGSSPDKGRCGCDDDTQCRGNRCCREDGRCSARRKMSVAPGGTAGDKCECLSLWYDSSSSVCGCTESTHCADNPEEICIEMSHTCGERSTVVGDPHITGFSGQKFDFTGTDGEWYALISEPPSVQLNMRVTAPIPSLPVITYITGLALLTTDEDGHDHSIVVTVKEPHNLATACPLEISRCLAYGSLSVLLDGREALRAPGKVSLAPGIEITAVNTPGECRSFGFEAYWARKKKQNAEDNRKLGVTLSMGEWILANPTATNMVDCTEYVARAEAAAGGLFTHQSEHSTFRIDTPSMNIRLSHGKLHQLATRDPTDTIDLPDHVTWQMNMAIEHTDVTHDAKGILGETFVPTRDVDGNMIMHGMECIRGTQADYAVDGSLGITFPMDGGAALQDATANVSDAVDGPLGMTFPTDGGTALREATGGTFP